MPQLNSTSITDFEVRVVDWDDPRARLLREAQRLEIETNFGNEQGKAPSASDISIFIVVVHTPTNTPAACGALRTLSATSVEIKRMYVIPECRGKVKVAKMVLDWLEQEALSKGLWDARVETGIMMPQARRFYEREGYHEIPLYGGYIGSTISVCYGKDLRAIMK